MTIHQAPSIRTTCPYCGVGCGLLAGLMVVVARRFPAIPSIRRTSARLLQGRGARRNAAASSGRLLHPMLRQRRRHALARADWSSRARPRRRRAFDRILERDGPERDRVLSLRATADRGLLRRQQADEGLSRLGQRRHQLAALHGVDRRRPSPRLRRRHGAGQLRGSRPRRSDRAGRLQRRLVPSGAVSSA